MKQNSSYQAFIATKNDEILMHKTEIKNAIDERLAQSSKYQSLVGEMNKIGKRDQIKVEIIRLNREIGKLRKDSGFSEDQNELYKRLANTSSFLTNRKQRYQKTIESLNSYHNYLENEISKFFSNSKNEILDYQSNSLEEYLIDHINTDVEQFIINSKSDFSSRVEEITEKVQTKISKLNVRISEVSEQIKPLQAIVKNQKHLGKLENNLKLQREKLTKIEEYGKEINAVIEKGKQARREIFDHYINLFDCYKAIKAELGKPEFLRIDQEIELQSELVFDIDKFEQFTDLFDNRTRLNKIFLRIFDDANRFIYDENTHVQAIESIFSELKIGAELPIKQKSGVEFEDTFYKLLSDYFRIRYRIIYKGDNILQMSPGKRGLVLLHGTGIAQ